MKTKLIGLVGAGLLCAGSLGACDGDPPPAYIGGLPVEEDASIAESLYEDGWRLVKVIQRAGYPCDSLTAVNPLWSSYVVACNNDAHTYEVGPVKGLKAEFVRVVG